MKRSFKKIAVLVVLSVFFASCSDDLDTTPEIPETPTNSFAFLQGDWEMVDKGDHSSGNTLHFDDDIAIQKLPNGSVVRAAHFQIVKSEGGNKFVYGKGLTIPLKLADTPNFFKNPKIVSASKDKLVLQGKEVFTFIKLDPVN